MVNINGFNGMYKVDEGGNIYSFLSGKVKKIATCPNCWGYLVFSMSGNGVKKSYKVHRIVAGQFINNPNPLLFNQINHIDGDKQNNHVSNLEWSNTKLNNLHKAKAGLSRKGLKPPKLGNHKKELIIQDHKETGIGLTRISRKYNIGISTAYRLLKSFNMANKQSLTRVVSTTCSL